MRSPFAIFRTHQKTLMVVVFGLAMIGFVLLGAVPDPSNMPQALVFITVVAVFGGAAWIAGMASGKSQEYGLWGVVLGLVAALAFSFSGRGPQLAVLADSGDITREQMQELQRRREIANGFVMEALRTTRTPRDAERLAPKYSFGFYGSIEEDLVTAALLRREADKLGLRVNDAAVTAFVNELTDNKMSAENFSDLRKRIKVSGPDLYSILAGELQARMAADYLYGINRQAPLGYEPAIPPEEYWDLYRRMNVKQRMEVAALPVKDFVDESVQPTPEELAELFDKYKANEPLVSPEERFEEGRPGFKQPRRVQIGYVEAVFGDFKPKIAEITDADIQAWYQERYVKPAEEAAARAAAARRSAPASTGPSLPDTLQLDLPELPAQPATDPPAGESPATDTPSPETPANETPATDPPASEAPSADPPATEAPAGDTPASEAPAMEPSKTETPPADAPSETPAPSDATPATDPKPGETSLNDAPADAGLFSVSDGETPAEATASDAAPAAAPPAASEPAATDTPTAEQPAASEPPAEASATETPASETPATSPETATEQPATPAEPSAAEAPVSETPAVETPEPDAASTPSETPPEATPPGTVIPTAPQSSIPLLDDALRAQIRTEIENARTVELLRKAVEDAARYIDDNIGLPVRLPKDDPEYKSPEAAVELLKTYATEHNLHYAETPLFSYSELQADEEHPVGAGRIADDPSGRPLADSFFQTGPQDIYRTVLSEHPVTQSWFAAWKLSEQQPYVPETLDDERVREQVTKTWRELQARERAKARGEELVAKASATDQSLTVSLAETTVTGREGDLFLEVKETPEFSWLSKSSAVEMNPFRPETPRIHDPAGVEGAGVDFMRTVFDELSPGEIGVAANQDRSIFYVVRVVSRTPSPTDDAELEKFREKFLREPVFEGDPFLARLQIEYPSPYEYLSVMETVQEEPNWARGPGGLWSRHGVELVPFQPQVAAQVQ